jgi:TPP-dependent pyruvate/acetoin dehydrogenase alpha subunit
MELSNLSQEEHLALYRMMVIIRQCEEQLARAFQRGLIPGPCHTYVGEEAIASGICANLREDDAVFSTHRGHGHALAKGVSPRQLVAELFGKITGISQGRGGSMHLFAPEVGLMGTSGIVGPSILQATGAGYTFKLLNQDRVGVAFLGDGAVSNGAFHEGLNLAAIWDLPVVFVCENNMYATEVAFSDATKNQDVAARARTYGMQGIGVDGNDVMAVYAAAENAVAHARAGKGPTLIECKTYRMRPHAEGMRDGGYRTTEEIESWKKRDPIATFKARLVAADIAQDSDFDSIDAEVSAIAEDAVQFAQDSPYPNPSTVSNHIFSS